MSQRVTANENGWQQMTASGITNEDEWELVKQSDFQFQIETKVQSGPCRILFKLLCNVQLLNIHQYT